MLFFRSFGETYGNKQFMPTRIYFHELNVRNPEINLLANQIINYLITKSV